MVRLSLAMIVRNEAGHPPEAQEVVRRGLAAFPEDPGLRGLQGQLGGGNS